MLFWSINTVQIKITFKKIKDNIVQSLNQTNSNIRCEKWANTKTNENKLSVFKRKILQQIFGPKQNEKGVFEVRTNEELRRLFGEINCQL